MTDDLNRERYLNLLRALNLIRDLIEEIEIMEEVYDKPCLHPDTIERGKKFLRNIV